MRHGQTESNLRHVVNGRKESKLTMQGKIDAFMAKEKLNVQFDKVFSSPLERARITANIMSGLVIVDENLNERSYGDFEGYMKKDFNYNGYWNFEKNLADHNVESICSLMIRVSTFIENLKKKCPNEKILLVTHSGFARALHYYLVGIPFDNDLTKLEIPNCCVRMYRI